MKAAQITNPKEPLEIREMDRPNAGGEEVILKVLSAGVCHSDLHLWEGGYDLGDGVFLKVTDRGIRYPVTPGHEIVGIVEEAGPDVRGIAAGDTVLVYPWLGCGSCKTCTGGDENLCETPRSIGLFQDGGYAEYVRVPSYRYLVDVSGVDPDSATSLACAALTAYTAVKKAKAGSPETIVIIGAGGLGLMGVQITKAITDANIICVDLDDAKLEMASRMGADHTINSKNTTPEEIAKQIASMSGSGADSVIDFVNAPPTARTGLASLRKNGSLILVGLFGGKLDISLVTIPLKSITIQGAYTGSYSDMTELVKLAKDGIIDPKITERYPLDDADKALSDLREKKIRGRAVINP